MIFVTVGAQMPFDRMTRTVDEWAGLRNRADVVAQIGSGGYRPKNIRFSQFMDPDQFYENVAAADSIVAHAGMGTIISAVERRKPILVMPRRSELGETRNDHQVATARQFEALKLVEVAMDEQDLFSKLDAIGELQNHARFGRSSSHCAMCPFFENPGACAQRASNAACPHLIWAVQAFVADNQYAIERHMASSGVPSGI